MNIPTSKETNSRRNIDGKVVQHVPLMYLLDTIIEIWNWECNIYIILVDVFVTSEDILMYILIVCYYTPIGDVCYPFTRCLNCV